MPSARPRPTNGPTSRPARKAGVRATVAASLCIAASLCVASCAGAPGARERLLASAEAIQQIESLIYEYSYEGSGSAAGSFSGLVLLVRPPDGPALYRAELRPSPSWDPAAAPRTAADDPRDPAEASGDAPPALILSGGGDHVAARDEALGRFSYGTISGGSGHLVANAPFAVLSAFTDAEPLAAERAGEFELVSRETVGGVLCDVLRGTTDEFGPARVWWHIGVEDDLPRAFRWEAEDGSGTLAFEIRSMEADSPVPADLLAIQVDVTDPEALEVIEEDARPFGPGVAAPGWTLSREAPPADERATLRLSDLRGEVVVLSFWSSWCAPCRELAAEVRAVSRRFGDAGVRFLALNGWEGADSAPGRTWAEWGLEAPVLLHAERIAADYKLISPPALFVVDARGDLALVRNPALEDPGAEARELERVLGSLLDRGD